MPIRQVARSLSIIKPATMTYGALLNALLRGFDVRDQLQDILFQFIFLFHPIRNAFIEIAYAVLQVNETLG